MKVERTVTVSGPAKDLLGVAWGLLKHGNEGHVVSGGRGNTSIVDVGTNLEGLELARRIMRSVNDAVSLDRNDEYRRKIEADNRNILNYYAQNSAPRNEYEAIVTFGVTEKEAKMMQMHAPGPRRFAAPSRSGRVDHNVVTLTPMDTITCTCPGYVNRRECWHVQHPESWTAMPDE